MEARKRLATLNIVLDDYRRPVNLLSGGQRQSVAIARAAQNGDTLVILDEPTAALGIRQTRSVVSLVRTLADSGVGVIVITPRRRRRLRPRRPVRRASSRPARLRRPRLVDRAGAAHPPDGRLSRVARDYRRGSCHLISREFRGQEASGNGARSSSEVRPRGAAPWRRSGNPRRRSRCEQGDPCAPARPPRAQRLRRPRRLRRLPRSPRIESTYPLPVNSRPRHEPALASSAWSLSAFVGCPKVLRTAGRTSSERDAPVRRATRSRSSSSSLPR